MGMPFGSRDAVLYATMSGLCMFCTKQARQEEVQIEKTRLAKRHPQLGQLHSSGSCSADAAAAASSAA
jgi:hypothetical protein